MSESRCGADGFLAKVQNALGRYGRDEQTEWTWSTVLEGPPRHRDLSWSLQWSDSLSERNGRKCLRQIMCRECRWLYPLLSLIIQRGRCLQAYFSAASDLHNQQTNALLSHYGGQVKKVVEDDGEQSMAPSHPGGNPLIVVFDQPLQFHRPPIPHVLLAASAVLGQLYDLRSTVARTGRNILKEKCRHQK